MAKQKLNLEIVEPSKLAAINSDIEALNDAVSKLVAAEKELRTEDIALRQTRPLRHEDALHNEALELLDGPHSSQPAKSAAKRLEEIAAERAKIGKALEIAEGRMKRLMFDRVIERKKLVADDWAKLQHERALTIAKLQRLNRDAQKMLAPLIDPNGIVCDMPAAFAQRPAARFLGGNGAGKAGDFGEFLELVIRLGIVTRDELKQA